MSMGVRDVVFSKHPGLSVDGMTEGYETFEELRCFRTSVERVISLFKRNYGLSHCDWCGFELEVPLERLEALAELALWELDLLDGGLEVVVDDPPRDEAEERGGADVAVQKGDLVLAVVDTGEVAARVHEAHDELPGLPPHSPLFPERLLGGFEYSSGLLQSLDRELGSLVSCGLELRQRGFVGSLVSASILLWGSLKLACGPASAVVPPGLAAPFAQPPGRPQRGALPDAVSAPSAPLRSEGGPREAQGGVASSETSATIAAAFVVRRALVAWRPRSISRSSAERNRSTRASCSAGSLAIRSISFWLWTSTPKTPPCSRVSQLSRPPFGVTDQGLPKGVALHAVADAVLSLEVDPNRPVGQICSDEVSDLLASCCVAGQGVDRIAQELKGACDVHDDLEEVDLSCVAWAVNQRHEGFQSLPLSLSDHARIDVSPTSKPRLRSSLWSSVPVIRCFSVVRHSHSA